MPTAVALPATVTVACAPASSAPTLHVKPFAAALHAPDEGVILTNANPPVQSSVTLTAFAAAAPAFVTVIVCVTAAPDGTVASAGVTEIRRSGAPERRMARTSVQVIVN